MTDPNTWHPYPRYGLAAAMVACHQDTLDFSNPDAIKQMLLEALEHSMTRFMIMRKEVPEKNYKGNLGYTYMMDSSRIDPGSKSGQNSANGFYAAPHVLTANNAAGIVGEVKNFIKKLNKPQSSLSSSVELKRSYAPLVAKMNNGKLSMSNPKVGLLMGVSTALATLTPYKASSYASVGVGDPGCTGIIPDLPFFDPQKNTYPLRQYIALLRDLIAEREGNDGMIGRYDKKFIRPAIFKGNFPNAPRNSSIGAVSLLVSIGEWVKEGKALQRAHRESFVSSILESLKGNPLYIVSNNGIKQERFGQHLITLALGGELKKISFALTNTRLMVEKSDDKKESPYRQTYKMMADRFLRLFTSASFRDFLAFRAEYPVVLSTLFEQYFMKNQSSNLTPELVASARYFGESLNLAAYLAAVGEVKSGQATNRNGPAIQEYKDKVLTQLESTIHSAKSGTGLLSRLSTIVGRITKREFPQSAIPFMEAVALGEEGGIGLNTAQELITAFMRVSTYKKQSPKPDDTGLPTDSTVFDELPST